MEKEVPRKKNWMDKRLLLPTIAIVVLSIVESMLENLEVGVPMKVVIKLLPVFGVAWWARVKSKIDNMRDELYKRMFQESASLALVLGILILLSCAQLQEEGLIKEIDMHLAAYFIACLWGIIYVLVRHRYISRAESN